MSIPHKVIRNKTGELIGYCFLPRYIQGKKYIVPIANKYSFTNWSFRRAGFQTLIAYGIRDASVLPGFRRKAL